MIDVDPAGSARRWYQRRRRSDRYLEVTSGVVRYVEARRGGEEQARVPPSEAFQRYAVEYSEATYYRCKTLTAPVLARPPFYVGLPRYVVVGETQGTPGVVFWRSLLSGVQPAMGAFARHVAEALASFPEVSRVADALLAFPQAARSLHQLEQRTMVVTGQAPPRRLVDCARGMLFAVGLVAGRGVPEPNVQVAHEGTITLEWQHGPRRLLIVCGQSGLPRYRAFENAREFSGEISHLVESADFAGWLARGDVSQSIAQEAPQSPAVAPTIDVNSPLIARALANWEKQVAASTKVFGLVTERDDRRATIPSPPTVGDD